MLYLSSLYFLQNSFVTCKGIFARAQLSVYCQCLVLTNMNIGLNIIGQHLRTAAKVRSEKHIIGNKLTNYHTNTYGCFDPLYVLMEVGHNGRCVFSSFLWKIKT